MSHVDDFARAVGEVAVAMHTGTADRLSDETLLAFLGIVGTNDQLPEHLRTVLAAVVAELLLRPIDAADAPAEPPAWTH